MTPHPDPCHTCGRRVTVDYRCPGCGHRWPLPGIIAHTRARHVHYADDTPTAHQLVAHTRRCAPATHPQPELESVRAA